MSIFILTGFTACSNAGNETAETQSAATAARNEEKGANTDLIQEGKNLVVYFSASGNTKNVAELIAAETNADMFELIPKDPYTTADLNWSDDNSRVTYEHDHDEARNIELESTSVENWESYETVFVGYPIWWHIAAWPVNDFVKANDFSGKTVVPFCTSASSDLGESGELLAEMAGTGNWLDGKRFSSGASEEDVHSWIESLGITISAAASETTSETTEATTVSETETETESESETTTAEVTTVAETTAAITTAATTATTTAATAASTTATTTAATTVTEPPVQGEKTLIAYFSWSGNTVAMAQIIADKTGGELFEIVPVTPYPTEYTPCTEVALEERDSNARPEIKNLPENIDEYDTILIGYPIWWHTAPMIIGTFLENYDLTGIDVYPFTQSASMDEEQFENSMEFVRGCAGKGSVHDGLFADAYDEAAIEKYLKDNGLAD
ncbi:MAG: hypothetical protein OSJ54_11805 [Oscillospiraceae bacterium]|nr:hypothetical protein [Oscillospiraceae bacterium]